MGVPIEQTVALMRLDEWVIATFRQLARTDAVAASSWRLHQQQQDLLDRDSDDRTPDDYDVIQASLAVGRDLSEQVYFLLMAAHHALVTAPRRVTQTGATGVPKPQTREDVELLRNIAEHWDAPERLAWVISERPQPPWLDKRLKAGRRFWEKHAPHGFPSSHAYSETGLSEIGGVLSVADLRGDLEAMRQYIQAGA